ncbi:copper resistance protein CopC [Amorphoplanes digitatis]|uniref:Methionine-rich copper-binding protein CopC n=1 Tax=Actinoplanes digitatis TaxID=1868 RepID=A0A7W7MRR4_9ACTN|nr:copper resistance CopC family protein [Actinoplanes digitatis]MBB4764556.1 methionine-rich copper-binding protein CopC [Actinoplanes digitatis]
MSAIAAATVLAVAVVAPPPAYAHGGLVSSTPAQGATVDAPVEAVSLAFTEKPAQFAFFAVYAPSGIRVDKPWSHAEPFRLDRPVKEYQLVDGAWQPREFTAGFPARVPVAHWPERGPYVVRYQSVASDGEPVAGEVRFTYGGAVTAAPPGWSPPTGGPTAELLAAAPAPSGIVAAAPSGTVAAAPVPDDRGPWPWLVPILLVVAVAGAVALAVTGRRTTTRRS